MSTTIFATVEAKPEVACDVEAALRKMIPPTNAEAGCVRYELFRSEKKFGTFHLLETYADEEALGIHHKSAHFTELVASLADKLARDIQIEHFVALDTE
jgi:quinol monooxygenase YgiN